MSVGSVAQATELELSARSTRAPGEGKRVPKRNKVCVGAKKRGLSLSVLPGSSTTCDLGLDLMEGIMHHQMR